MTDGLMSVEQVGDLLGLSTSAVWRLLQQGDIPGAKIGGQWRVQRHELDLHFNLARARTLAQVRERDAETVWAETVTHLGEKYDGRSFIAVRCLWCPEFTPADASARFTTLCSLECAAELRATFELLGWPLDSDLVTSPIYDSFGDGEYWIRGSLGKVHLTAIMHGIEPDPEGLTVRWALKHQRGPLRELLALEHPTLRRIAHTQTTGSMRAAEAPADKGVLKEVVSVEETST